MRLPLILTALLLATAATAQGAGPITPAAQAAAETAAPVEATPVDAGMAAMPAPAPPAAAAASPAAAPPAPASPAAAAPAPAETPAITATEAAPPALAAPAAPASGTEPAPAPVPAPGIPPGPAAATPVPATPAPPISAPPAATAPAPAAQAPATTAPEASSTALPGTAPASAQATPPGPAAASPAPGLPLTAPVMLAVPPMALSPREMFLHADIVVKSVMVGLAFASVVTWTVFIVKLIELAMATREVGRSHARIEAADSLAEAMRSAGQGNDPASHMLRAAAREMERSAPALSAPALSAPALSVAALSVAARAAPALAQAGGQGVRERVASHLDRIEARASRRIARGTGLLATVGSTAPFVGLFGTVWGIMNSFIGIAKAQTTNLSIVAPGIAEALLATGIGLVAAIPAVMIYNLFARATAGYRLRLGDASASVQRLVSRELDMTGIAP